MNHLVNTARSKNLMIKLLSETRAIVLLTVALMVTSKLWAAETVYQIGVAQIDITPGYPVRLSGFGFRRTESEGVTQKIWAKALAIGDPQEGPAILIALDNLGVPDEMVQ